MTTINRTTLSALTAGVLTVAMVGAPATAASDPTPAVAAVERQPAPRLSIPRDGSLPVGTRVLSLTDRSRTDPWRPRSGPRRLVVTMTDPARAAATARPRAGYMTAAESAALLDLQEQQGAELPASLPRDLLADVRLPARRGGAVRASGTGRPLVLLSPGFGLPRATMTGLATSLAAHGYVVASVDHVGESSGTQLPGGRLVGCAACDVEDYSTVARGRVRDLSFVLDRLLGPDPAWGGARVVDPARVGVVGHSIGGNSAVSLARDDDRIAAAVNLDGTFFDEVGGALSTPVLMMGTRELHRPSGDDESWPRAWDDLAGPRTWLTVRGAVHFSGIDLPLLVDQAGLGDPGAALPGRRALHLTRSYVRAFLDLHLRDRDGELLDGPSGRFPDVSFHDPS